MEVSVHSHNTRLWKTLLGSLVASCLACGGGGSGSGTTNDGGGLGDGAGAIDVLLASPDLTMASVDQAAATMDQAPASVDQTVASVDLGSPQPDAGPDLPAADAQVVPDVPMQMDLAGTPDALVNTDVSASPDLPPALDLSPVLDSAPVLDSPPVFDVSVTPDLSAKMDAPPMLDTTAEIDALAAVDTVPQMLAPDKLTYAPGSQLTATFNNGSTDTTAWIGIFPVGAANTAYRDWDYTDGATSGTMILHVPGTPGTYELRMFADNGYTRIATSVPFTVE
jgi:hypothetical protein